VIRMSLRRWVPPFFGDPTSHNLCPIDLVIAAVVGLLASSAGALLGSVPLLLSHNSGT
jgi:hypothetical protein